MRAKRNTMVDTENNDLDDAMKFAVEEAGYEVVGIEEI